MENILEVGFQCVHCPHFTNTNQIQIQVTSPHKGLDRTMSNITKLSNIIIIVALLVVYVHFFGYDTVERFSKRGVTTVTTTEKQSTITPPSKNIHQYKIYLIYLNNHSLFLKIRHTICFLIIPYLYF